ncbi:MAG: O-antigen ligase family protein [Verrucomicrobia bacterium]|nr:O-antigen ligase family protein [Verrucomicrobiota bacterium]
MTATSKTRQALNNASRNIVLSAVVLSPWLYGSSEPWAYLLATFLVVLGTGVWCFSAATSRHLDLRARPVTIMLLALAAYLILQILPLPMGITRVLNPWSADITADATEAFRQLPPGALIDFSDITATLSVSAKASMRSLLLFMAYAGTFLVFANTIRFTDELQRVAAVLVGSATLLAVLALAQKFSGSDRIYWFHTPLHAGDMFGTFSNLNHFAANMNMAVGVAIGSLATSRGLNQIVAWPSWADRMDMLTSRDGVRTALRALMTVILVLAVAVSASMGAQLCLIITFTLAGILSLCQRHAGRRALYGFIPAMIIILILVVARGQSNVQWRMGDLASFVQNPFNRLHVAVSGDAFSILSVCPVFGTGFGTFRHVFPAFQSAPIQLRWLHAHNDWLQLLVEGGVVGAVLFLMFALGCLRYVLRRLKGAPDRARLVIFGLLFGITTIAIHSLFDYGLRKPANALLLSAMAGMAVAGVHVTSRQRPRKEPQSILLSRLAAWGGTTLALMAVTGLLVMILSNLRGELALARFRYAEQVANRTTSEIDHLAAASAALGESPLAIRLAGDNADGMTSISAALLRFSHDPMIDRPTQLRMLEQASAAAIRAAASAPSDYLSWLWLARIHASLGDWDTASASLRRARRLTAHPQDVRMFTVPPDDQEEQRQIP